MRMIESFSVVVLLGALLTATGGEVAPSLPAELQAIDASMRKFPGSIGWGLCITSKVPLSESQWTAVAGVPVVSFNGTGAFMDADGIARLAALPIESLVLSGCHADGDAVGAFTRMTKLRRLAFSHCRLGDGLAQALAKHPSLEELTSDNVGLSKGIGLIATSPKLRRIRLGHGAANDRAALALANHPTLDDVDFWATGNPVLTEAGVLHLTTITGLKKLAIHNTAVTHAGSLHRLKDLPQLTTLVLGDVDLNAADLALLKADLPQVSITADLMTPEERTKWDQGLAYRLKQEDLAERKRAAAEVAEAAEKAANNKVPEQAAPAKPD